MELLAPSHGADDVLEQPGHSESVYALAKAHAVMWGIDSTGSMWAIDPARDR